ncbi:hypothetical protein EJB05_13518, partial [Eragrostis curvula]
MIARRQRRTLPGPTHQGTQPKRAASSMMAAQTLMNDLVEEILLRFPPEDPASLVRAALVCTGWRRLILNSRFGRRFREFHSTPPMLGFLCNLEQCDDDGGVRSSKDAFVPNSFPHPPPARSAAASSPNPRARKVELPKLPSEPPPYNAASWNAAVLCAAGSGACDHLDCHRGPFLVLFIGHAIGKGPVCYNSTILKYDLTSRNMSEIQLPDTVDSGEIVLITTEDDGLGFACIAEDFKLCLGSKVADPDEGAGWAQNRVIELEALLPASALSTSPQVLGFAEGVGVIVLWTDDGFFTINLRSCQVMEVEDDGEEGGNIYNVVPYVSFYTPLLKYNVLN